jgi:fatty-acyl-CoA synthase
MALRFATPASEAYNFPLTIGHLLDSALISAADQEIVYRDKIRFTYREFRQRVGRLASVLADLGAEQGTVVAVMDWDSHRYLEAYFAVPMMGAVLETINVRLSPQQIAYTLEHAEAQVLIVHRDFLELAQRMLPQLPRIKAVIAILDGADESSPVLACGEYEALLSTGSPDYKFSDFDENAIATTFYTTGTTGNPKGVCFSHRQIVLFALASKAPFGVTRNRGLGHGEVYMPLTPMFHVHAWGMPYVATMLGLKQVYPGRYEPDLLIDLKLREGVTFSHCVPTIMEMVLTAADRRGADLSGWTVKIGGSAMTAALFRAGRERGMELLSGYGMSETCPTICVARRHTGSTDEADEIAALTAAGVPLPLVSVRIVDEQMNTLPNDGSAQGELVVRAPWLTPCYVGAPEESESLWQGGWLHTRDVATIDALGYIRIRDRLKDVIKSGGEWVSSLALEDLVAAVGGVAEVAAVGVPHARWGERPIIIATLKDGFDPRTAAEEIMARLRAAAAAGQISRYAIADRVEIVEAIPRTSVGKIDKKALRARFAATLE